MRDSQSGTFRTTLAVVKAAESVAVLVSLAAASESLNPLFLDVLCPRASDSALD